MHIPSMSSVPVVMRGAEFAPVDGLACPEGEMPGQPVDFGHVDA
jgi:hypothetical protein